MMRYTKAEIDNFSSTVESLKKYRRADLIDEDGKSLLDELYTDLLPNDYIIKKCLFPNTTFLIGRKGTGKSTIFLKIESELRKQKGYLPCYIDVKTVYESSRSQSYDYKYLEDFLSAQLLTKYLLERTFIQNVLMMIKKEISDNYESKIDKLIGKFLPTKKKIINEKIGSISKRIEDNKHLAEIEIPIIKKAKINTNNEKGSYQSSAGSIGIPDVTATVGIESTSLELKNKTHYETSNKLIETSGTDTEFSEVFLKVFQIKDVINEIKEILKILEIKHLVVLLDDLSEIDDHAIKMFVDTIIAPLNNWSEEFIKFKIAAYPNRIHFGKIDPGKIDTINLDFYNLYSEFDRNKMEEHAVDFTKRLLEKRIHYYTNKDLDYYFDTTKSNITEYYELLFYASMNVPRIIGYILSYCHQNRIIFNRKITKADIESAAEKYYIEKINIFFKANTYCLLSMDERISIFQMNELKQLIIEKLLEIKRRIVSGDLKGRLYTPGYPYSSHFHVDPKLDEFLRTLELNHFISKYDELSDRDGNPINIYCINYGMAKNNGIVWGKAKGSEYRKYFIERPFNFTRIIADYISTTKKIQCSNKGCNKLFNTDDIPGLEFNNYKCNSCGSPVTVEQFTNQFHDVICQINEENLLPKTDLNIILELSNNKFARKYAREIAEELDYSKYLVAMRCKKLSEKDLIIRARHKKTDPYKYSLTNKAKQIYIE